MNYRLNDENLNLLRDIEELERGIRLYSGQNKLSTRSAAKIDFSEFKEARCGGQEMSEYAKFKAMQELHSQ